MDNDILQSTLDDLSHLLIPPSQITLEENNIDFGGYGRVFLAILRSSDSQTKVVVKQLRIQQAIQVRQRVAIRLAREVKVWAKAKHPNVHELVGFHLTADYTCAQLVSACMANGNVREYIDKVKPNLATRLRFVQGITSGMSYLHNCSPAICHGDLKPTNVLVNDGLDAVLCDFGIATFLMESGASYPRGWARYMGPELLLYGEEAKLTLESDVWAWACTTFEVLTNCVPFPDARSEAAVIVALVHGRIPGSVDLLDSLVSDGLITYHSTIDSLKSILPHCWIMDSAKRPSSSEILNHLVFPDRIEASDIAAASSHLSAMEDRQPELLPPPITDSPTGMLEKRARREDAAIGPEYIGILHNLRQLKLVHYDEDVQMSRDPAGNIQWGCWINVYEIFPPFLDYNGQTFWGTARTRPEARNSVARDILYAIRYYEPGQGDVLSPEGLRLEGAS